MARMERPGGRYKLPPHDVCPQPIIANTFCTRTNEFSNKYASALSVCKELSSKYLMATIPPQYSECNRAPARRTFVDTTCYMTT